MTSPTTKAKKMPAPPTGQQIAQDALKYVGSPYVFGGNPYSVGQLLTDCSGLVDRAFADLGMRLPGRPTTTQLLTMGNPVANLASAQPGDLVFLEGGDHVGIYLGNGKMVHDPQPGEAVKVSDVYQTPFSIRRLTANAGTPAGSTSSGAAGSASGPAASAASAVTGWLDSVAVRVGLVVLGGALVLLGISVAVPGRPVGAAVSGMVKP